MDYSLVILVKHSLFDRFGCLQVHIAILSGFFLVDHSFLISGFSWLVHLIIIEIHIVKLFLNIFGNLLVLLLLRLLAFLTIFNHLFVAFSIIFLLSLVLFFSLLLFKVSLSLLNNCLHVAFVRIGSIDASLYERVSGLTGLNLSVQGHMSRCKVGDFCLILHDLSHARKLVFL